MTSVVARNVFWLAPGKPHHTIRANSDLVLIPVSVIDAKGRFVTGLGREAFRVFDKHDEQKITYFAEEDVAVSLGIVFDSSGSMKNKLWASREALACLARFANAEDEFFVVRFDNRPELTTPFHSDIGPIQSSVLFTQATGKTALLDAVYMAFNYMKNAKNPRRVLLVISDGVDNHSRYSREDVRHLVRESAVPIYSIGLYGQAAGMLPEEEGGGAALLNEIADESGGRQFEIHNPAGLMDTAAKLGRELHNQYVLGFSPLDSGRDGQYHRTRVRVDGRGLRVFARPGYWATEPQK